VIAADRARIEVLEREVEQLGAKLAAVFEEMRAATRAAGVPSEEFRAAAQASAGGHQPHRPATRHLSLVRPSS
jgi:hypothetical protein